MIASFIDSIGGYPPSSQGGFPPDSGYPEYRYPQLAATPNAVYSAVRSAFAQAGLDAERFGTPEWNPLRQWVTPGSTVFVLCNFVYHRRPGESDADFLAKCTHASVLRPLIDYLLIAVGPTGSVHFGNAPVQSCDWARVLHDTGADRLVDFYHGVGEPVEARDLRLVVSSRSRAGAVRHEERRDEAMMVPVDLGADSLLAQLPSGSSPLFRVADYDARRTQTCHRDGVHTYLLNREVLQADVLVSVPKLKTHEKVGLTLALKGCVGAVASKECLAHHRRGLPAQGGDEYATDSLGLKRIASALHDRVQMTDAGHRLGASLRIADRLFRSALHRWSSGIGGSWSGNDTAWRMALDLARIVTHARSDGRVEDRLVRPHLVLLDGVVGGEGEGPLRPTAVRSGLVMFADNPVLADRAAARLVGFLPERVPLLREASRLLDPAHDGAIEAGRIVSRAGASVGYCRLAPIVGFRPPRGWEGVNGD